MPKPSLKNEQGIAHLLIMALGIIIVIGVLATGVFVFANNKNKGATLADSNSNSALNNCLNKYKDSRICQFAVHYTPISKVPYSANVVVTSPQGTISNIQLQSDGNGNTALSGTSDGQQLSTVVLDGNTYVNDGSRVWLEYKAGSNYSPAQTDPTANMDITVGDSGLSFTFVDTESCGSLQCYKYLVADSASTGSTQYIWFDTSSYQLRQWSYNGSTGKSQMTISYQPETITAPSPVDVLP
jgi:hypothetical protein